MRRRTFVRLWPLSLLLTRCGPREDTPESGGISLRIAAASDLRFSMEPLVRRFRSRFPDVEVSVSYGSSGNFYAQLRNRAPFDLFLSADILYPRKLREEGLVLEDSEFLYAVGRLALWCPNSSPLDIETLGVRALEDPAVRRVAIANPQHAPYGQAAEAALRSLGLYDAVKEKLVLGDNVAQALHFVQSGAAEAGIVALALALAPEVRPGGRYWEIPLDAYPRMDQGGAILSYTANATAAGRFRDFLLSKEGRSVLRDYGFFMPGE